jgi:hypothetical protein
MQTAKLNERLQLFASLSVLIGLLLVAYEVRQNNVLAEAEAVTAMQTGWETISISEYETDIGELRAKSINDPENLTEPELYKLDGWLTAITMQYDRRLEFEERGLGYGTTDAGYDLASDIGGAFDHYVNNRFGRAWFIENRGWIDPIITDIWDQKMQENTPDSEYNYAERLKERIRQQQPRN